MKLPTIEQIAAMAANIQTETTADGKVCMAMDIWVKAHCCLLLAEMQDESIQSDELLLDSITRGLYNKMPLADFLKAIYPKSKTADTMKWYRDFLVDELALFARTKKLPELSLSKIQSHIARLIEDQRLGGVDDAEAFALKFMKHRNQSAQQIRKNKAAIGGAKKNTKKQKKVLDASENGTSKTNAAPSKSNRAPSRKNAAPTSKKRAGSKQ
jgi:hypothetical protein